MTKYLNIKNGKIYIRLRDVINATNKDDGQVMVLYCRNEKYFVREREEFNKKFKFIIEKSRR
jgi:hypothetical protein